MLREKMKQTIIKNKGGTLENITEEEIKLAQMIWKNKNVYSETFLINAKKKYIYELEQKK